ncbi:putative S-layer protein [Pleurocapsa sp. PCC 7327]|uniref:S-layer homology domain-containing protein n=1 Tax=Pleurocapsa sp. PCC 7327 TaxID=118163 RepID=UPI00029FB1D1|nr:S-layer homology domain-containing protein [Pleurocapsa sp. PCC 7327]AFY76944.1 putative S-layer protein [Pleurocapsa sp. PCC 7327]
MSNSPNPEPPRRRNLDSDEKIAIIFVLATIGGILWWGLGSSSGINFFKNQPQLLARSRSQPTAQPEQSRPIVALREKPATTELPEASQKEAEQPSQLFEDPDRRQTNRQGQTLPLLALPIPLASQPSPQSTPTPKSQEPSLQLKIAFQDVPRERWDYPFIEGLRSKQLIDGVSENTFEPDRPISRAQMASLIDRAFDSPSQAIEIEFKDVPQGDPIASDIEKAIGKGFMKGYSRDSFRPQENIPRYQVLVTLVAGLNLKPTKDPQQTLKVYEDASEIPTWAVGQVAAATEKGIVVNYPNTKFLNPNQPATRGEAAAMMHQALVNLGKVEPVQSPYIVPSP